MLHKRLISVFAGALSLCLMSAFGQSHPSDDEEFVHKHQFDLVKVSCERIDEYAVTRVFRIPIYHLTVSIKDGYGQSPYWGNLVAARVGDELVPIPRPVREGDYPDLLAMFRTDFKLTSEDAAETLQRALDFVFPGSLENVWAEKFHHDGTQWSFVRGRSLGPPGPGEFVLTTDEQGKITEVKYVRGPLLPASVR